MSGLARPVRARGLTRLRAGTGGAADAASIRLPAHPPALEQGVAWLGAWLREALRGRRRLTVLAGGAAALLAGAAILPSLAGVGGAGSQSALDALGGSADAAGTSAIAAPGIGSPDLLDLGAKLLLVVALLYVALRVLRRVSRGTTTADAHLRVLESRTLAHKATLHLVAVGDRRIVVGHTPAGLALLAEMDADELESPAAAAALAAPHADVAADAVPETFADAYDSAGRSRVDADTRHTAAVA